MARDEINELTDRLRDRQAEVSKMIIELAQHEDLEKSAPDGFTVRDILQMWVHEIRSHHRDLIMARGPLTNDNPHFHVPHFVRRANEEFGKLVGELSVLSDQDLERQVPPSGRTIREIAQHVLETLDGYFVQQLKGALDRKED